MLLICYFVLLIGTLFLSHDSFVESKLSPKWYVAGFSIATMLLIESFYRLTNRVKRGMPIISNLFLMIIVSCGLQAVYGIWQLLKIYSVSGMLLSIFGSFDNPAGFSACLSAGFPFCLYFFHKNNKLLKNISTYFGMFIVLGIVLSASRAGIVSLLVIFLVYIIEKNKIIQETRKNYCIIFCVVVFVLSLYFAKKDSADGRILIWKCSYNMIQDKVIMGHGIGGFRANYMKYQAFYFERHPNSKFSMLADNINHPFNEYILLLVNFGLIGLLLFCGLCFLLRVSYKRNQTLETKAASFCLLSIGIFAMFSYPLVYPFIWVLILISTLIIISSEIRSKSLPLMFSFSINIFTILFSIFFCIWLCKRMQIEKEWCYVARNTKIQFFQRNQKYASLYKGLNKDGLFLYNYAAELNNHQKYLASQIIANRCNNIISDYDLQLIIGDNYFHTKQFKSAIKSYQFAAFMCPSRFTPLYQLAKIYKEIKDTINYHKMAFMIINKPLKIKSNDVLLIQHEMKGVLYGSEKRKTINKN